MANLQTTVDPKMSSPIKIKLPSIEVSTFSKSSIYSDSGKNGNVGVLNTLSMLPTVSKPTSTRSESDDQELSTISSSDLHVEEWFKSSRSDSFSSLDFDADIQKTEMDVTDFLTMKNPIQIQSEDRPQVDMDDNHENQTVRNLLSYTLGDLSSDPSSLMSSEHSLKGASIKKEICSQLEKNLLEEMSSVDSNHKRKECLSADDNKGLFEELLLPSMQDWLQTVSLQDKKEISALESSCNVTPVNEPESSGIKDYDDYDLIGKNVLSLKLMTPQEIESLPTRNLGFDDAQPNSKNLNDATEELSFQCPITSDIDHKLLNILAMDASNDSLENSSFSSSEIQNLPKLNENPNKNICVSKHEIKDVSSIYLTKVKKDLLNDRLPILSLPECISNNCPTNRKPLKPNCHLESKPLASEANHLSQALKNKTEKHTNVNSFKETKTHCLSSKASEKVSSISTNNNQTIFLKTIKKTNLTNSYTSNSIALNSDKKESSKSTSSEKQGGLAKVNIAVNCKANSTNVSIISSNKEHTVFKINTSDLVRAISSIKEPYLEPLGLSNHLLMDTANSAQKLLDLHSNMNAKGESNDITNWPQNFQINQHIQEIKAPILRTKNEFSKVDSVGQLLSSSTISNNIIFKNKKCSDSAQSVNSISSIASKTKPDKPIKKKSEFVEKSRQVENVGISLVSGGPPTMVSVPSILDALSGPTSSKVNLAQVLGGCSLKNNNQSDEDLKGQDEQSMANDEKTNAALIQLGIEPDTLLPEIGPEGTKVWVCRIPSCTKMFAKLSYLKIHILTHKGIRPYKCSYEKCDWSFYTSYKLKRHLETHLKRRDFVCTEPDCNRRFTTIYNLKTHELIHRRPKSWHCSLSSCNMNFHTRRLLENHMKQHKNLVPPYKCTVEGCSKGYFTTTSLSSHVRSHHKDEDLKCQWQNCGKKFDKPCRLKAHMRIHTGQRPYVCNYEGCKWTFQCASKLSRHQRKHTNDRKYFCPICKKGFLRSEHLKGHLLTHTGVRNFECPIPNCHAKFTAKSSLYVHLKKHKSSKSPVKLHCPIETCNRKYDNKHGLRQHLRKEHTSFLDSSQMDYITLIGDKEVLGSESIASASLESLLPSRGLSDVSAFMPLNLKTTSPLLDATLESSNTKYDVATGTARGDSEFLGMHHSTAATSEAPQEVNLALSMPESLFTSSIALAEAESSQSVSDLGFPELSLSKDTLGPKNNSKYLCFPSSGSSSARTDVRGNILLSRMAKQRQHETSLRKLHSLADLSKGGVCSDLLASPVDHFHFSNSFQTPVIQDDVTSTSLYEDSLINHNLLSDSSSEHQSTINLRDLE